MARFPRKGGTNRDESIRILGHPSLSPRRCHCGAVTFTTDWRGFFFPSNLSFSHIHICTHIGIKTQSTDPVHSQTRKAAGVLCSHRHPSGSERQSLTEMMVRCAVCGSKMISIGGDTARFAITIVEYYRPAPSSLSLSFSSLFSFFILVRSTLACLSSSSPCVCILCVHPLTENEFANRSCRDSTARRSPSVARLKGLRGQEAREYREQSRETILVIDDSSSAGEHRDLHRWRAFERPGEESFDERPSSRSERGLIGGNFSSPRSLEE